LHRERFVLQFFSLFKLELVKAMSNFTDRYLTRWLELQATPGLFRNPHYVQNQRRRLPGAMHITAQFNPHHLANKRPSGMTSTNTVLTRRAFDPAIFNFTRANPAELVCSLTADLQLHLDAIDLKDASQTVHPVFVNPSPLFCGHGLLVPDLHAKLPQQLTTSTLLIALQFLRAAQSTSLRLGFNSLGGWASVNHCHFHLLHASDIWPEHGGQMPIELAPLVQLASVNGITVSELKAWPLPGFVFSAAETSDAALKRLAACCAQTVESLYQIDQVRPVLKCSLLVLYSIICCFFRLFLQPHQLLMLPTAIYLLPRAPQPPSIPRCAVALAELCGLAVVYSKVLISAMIPLWLCVHVHVWISVMQDDFDAFTEDDFCALMSEAVIGDENFQKCRDVAISAASQCQ
jgi:GDP-L-galactose phosphorylase